MTKVTNMTATSIFRKLLSVVGQPATYDKPSHVGRALDNIPNLCSMNSMLGQSIW